MGRSRRSSQGVLIRVKFLYLMLLVLHAGSWMAGRRLVLLAVVAFALLTPAVARAQPSMESEVFAKINAARSKKLIFHSGVHSVAWQHSADMSSAGGLNHDNADARISNAAPDPAEGNGAPDDGYGHDWCENVTYVNFGTEAEAAGRIYEAWRRSGAHQRCMQDTTLNTGAVGIYYDGTTWWATFIAYIDHTPPGTADTTTPPQSSSEPVAKKKTAVAAAPETTSDTSQAASTDSPAESSNAGSVTPKETDESTVQPSSEPAPRRILVIPEPGAKAAPVSKAGTESYADALLAAVRNPKVGVNEVAGAFAASICGFLVMLLRLKRRTRLPRTMTTAIRKVDKVAGTTSRLPIPHGGSRERDGAAQRPRELVRS